jgi:hypothetical protein
MKDQNCRYCTRTTDIVELVADLEVSTRPTGVVVSSR